MMSMELLAPAGSLETFDAALDGGADAVYVGAPGFNARNLARDVRLEEIGGMIRHCHSQGKKIYIAANSLILERELPLVIENLAILEELGPDALIVQDLGLIRLVRTFFPKLKLHGSTLMTVHNSDGLRFQAELGCERVVLARELTLKEIQILAKKRGHLELEVFIHGAMCFSYSGLCLFSSYLGGKSGLRGRCVQPCRRAYRDGSKKGGAKVRRGDVRGDHRGRYLFSMNDLQGLEAVPFLQQAGISSLKIEGRLRTAHYVRSVVCAYRKLIDCDPADLENQKKTLAEARELVDQAMSRKTTSGYFFSPQPAEAITPYHSGNMGVHLGKFSATRVVGENLTCRFVTKKTINLGDRLRLHVEPSGERTAFRLKSLYLHGAPVESASAGSKVSIELPAGFATGPGEHVVVYKVDGRFRTTSGAALTLQMEAAARELKATRRKTAPTIERIKSLVTAGTMTDEQSETGRTAAKDRTKIPLPGYKRQVRKKLPLEWWLKTDSPKLLQGKLPLEPDRYLLCFNSRNVKQAGRLKSELGKRARMLTWALPPLIMQKDLPGVEKQLSLLIRSGFRSFQLGHLSQSLLFKGEKVYLFADYTANLFNSQAVALMQELKVGAVQTGIELDRNSLRELLAGCRAVGGSGRPGQGTKTIPAGVTVYGAPALYTSRLSPDHLPIDRQILSPRDEPYVVRKSEGFSQTFPEKPFSLLPYLEDLKQLGVKYVVVDISGGESSNRSLQEIHNRLFNTGRYSKLSTFNYLGHLQ